MTPKITYKPNTSFLIEKARLHANRSKAKLESRFPEAFKKLDELHFNLKDIRRHSAKILSGAAIAGSLVLSSPSIQHTVAALHHERPVKNPSAIDKELHDRLALALPKIGNSLTASQEQDVNLILKETLGIDAVAELDGHRLNTSIGRMGGEQHLPRYPGDTIGSHDELQVKGITSNRGAFGYFSQSKDTMTNEDEMREKYYVAVQTMYLPHWNSNYKTLKDWYKFRKVLVVNPTTGKSVIAVVGDAGPAAWTGKQFGGSPELMQHLQPFANKNNGMVLLFFIKDANNTLALGPVNGQSAQYIAANFGE